MFDTVSLAEIDGQRGELLPARTVMSVFGMDPTAGGGAGDGGGAAGGSGTNILSGIGILSELTANAGNAAGGSGGAIAPPAP